MPAGLRKEEQVMSFETEEGRSARTTCGSVMPPLLSAWNALPSIFVCPNPSFLQVFAQISPDYPV